MPVHSSADLQFLPIPRFAARRPTTNKDQRSIAWLGLVCKDNCHQRDSPSEKNEPSTTEGPALVQNINSYPAHFPLLLSLQRSLILWIGKLIHAGDMNTATSTSTSVITVGGADAVSRRHQANEKDVAAAPPAASKTETANGAIDPAEELKRAFRKKYRHVQAIHSQTRPSCLSHDATVNPSFLGFRNLMVIVLGNLIPFPPLC